MLRYFDLLGTCVRAMFKALFVFIAALFLIAALLSPFAVAMVAINFLLKVV